MPAYRVTVNGEKFHMERYGKVVKLGFFATVHIEAADEELAKAGALAAMEDVEELGENVKNPPDSPPTLYVESIVPIDALDDGGAPPRLDWYSHDDDEDLGDPMAEVEKLRRR
jgi:hypothetical protein